MSRPRPGKRLKRANRPRVVKIDRLLVRAEGLSVKVKILKGEIRIIVRPY